MKRIGKIILLLMFVLALGIGISNNTNHFSRGQTSQQKIVTPIKSLINYAGLSNIYYYDYSKGVPNDIKKDFKEAVLIYQATGIVKLRQGKAPKGQNQIMFGVYDNKQKRTGPGMVEFGYGGVGISLNFANGIRIVNHGRANLNLAYAGAMNSAVAVHELGHALGLVHSNNPDSVVYPIENWETHLTNADLNALQRIYKGKSS